MSERPRPRFRGVMQSPVTPLKDDFSLDVDTFEKVVDFHVRAGATAISWPRHKGESLSLTIEERQPLAEVAVRTVAGREVTVHVSALAVEDTFALARKAQEKVAALRHLAKAHGVGGFKAASSIMRRDCGIPRPPLEPIDSPIVDKLATGIAAMLAGEPKGW